MSLGQIVFDNVESNAELLLELGTSVLELTLANLAIVTNLNNEI
jgi:hypothetical protein